MFLTNRAHKHHEELWDTGLTAQCWRRQWKGPLKLFICQHLMNCLMDNYHKSNNCKIKNWNLDAIEVFAVLKFSYVLPDSCPIMWTLRNQIIEVYHYSQLWRSNRSAKFQSLSDWENLVLIVMQRLDLATVTFCLKQMKTSLFSSGFVLGATARNKRQQWNHRIRFSRFLNHNWVFLSNIPRWPNKIVKMERKLD